MSLPIPMLCLYTMSIGTYLYTSIGANLITIWNSFGETVKNV